MTSAAAASALVAAATVASVPGAAIAYAVPPHGPVALPPRWWCGAPAPVPARVAIAAVAAAAAGLLASTTTDSAMTAALTATSVVYLVLAVTDLRVHRLPHRMTAAAWITAAFAVSAEVAACGKVAPATGAVATTIAVVAVLLGIAVALPGQLGLGDVNLAGTISLSLAWSGWITSVIAVFIGLAFQAAIAAVALVYGGNRHTQLPLGPSLVAGWLITALLMSP